MTEPGPCSLREMWEWKLHRVNIYVSMQDMWHCLKLVIDDSSLRRWIQGGPEIIELACARCATNQKLKESCHVSSTFWIRFRIEDASMKQRDHCKLEQRKTLQHESIVKIREITPGTVSPTIAWRSGQEMRVLILFSPLHGHHIKLWTPRMWNT